MTSDMRARPAGADDERCGAAMHEDAHDEQSRAHTCGAKPHDADQAHIAYDDDGAPILQWHELSDDADA